MSKTLITDIAKAVGETDTALDLIIADFIAPDTDVAAWRIANYSELRRWAYPNPFDLTDAMVKIENGDSEQQLEGQAQRTQYYDECYAVKARFPK